MATLIEWSVRCVVPDNLSEETMDALCDVLDEQGAQDAIVCLLGRLLNKEAHRRRTQVRIELIGTADGGATALAGRLS